MKIHWFEQNASDVPAENDWLSAFEQLRVDDLHLPKRREEWRMGRWTAKHAVAGFLDLPCDRAGLAAIEIRASETGVPHVIIQDESAPVCISISHRSAWAICAVAPPGSRIGCDLELVEPRSDAFVADYFTSNEQQQCASTNSAAERDCLANLLWSAKESALKALGYGLTVDSRDAEVTFFQRPESDDPAASVDWYPLEVTHLGREVFHGWWQRTGMLLRTMVATPKPLQPHVVDPRHSFSRVAAQGERPL